MNCTSLAVLTATTDKASGKGRIIAHRGEIVLVEYETEPPPAKAGGFGLAAEAA